MAAYVCKAAGESLWVRASARA